MSWTAGFFLAVLFFPTADAQVLGWQVFNTTNSGMPDNRVHAVCMDDSTGWLWVGTDNGLARFDGSSWISWNTSTSGLPDNSIRSLQPDGIGGIWVGTFAGGLVHFDGTNWTLYNTSNSALPDLYVRSLALDLNGGLWIGTTAGLVHWQDTVWHVYNTLNSDMHSNNIACLHAPRPDTVWVGTINGGLTYIQGEDWTDHRIATTGIGDNSIVGVTEDGHGRAWIATPAAGVNYWAGTWFKWNTGNSGIPTNSLTCIDLDSTQSLWLGSTDKGLLWKSPAHLFLQVAGPDTFVRCLDYHPGSHTLWVGTNDSGLVRYTLPSVGREDPSNQLHFICYPNPASEFIRIESSQRGSLKIVSMAGEELASWELVGESHTLSLEGLAPQLVLVVLTNENGTLATRIIRIE